MSYYIVTNNPLVKEDYERTIFVEGSYMDILIKVRDLVHSGHELINHPLGASIRMLYSPYRSIIVSEKTDSNNQYFLEMIESSIDTYNKHMGVRKPDIKNGKDYALIDKELLKSALDEHKRLGIIYKN